MTCTKIASGRAVLIGDAAHAMSANLGMACSAALQDGEILSRACVATAGDVAAATARYNSARLSNVQALTRLTRALDGVYNYRSVLGAIMNCCISSCGNNPQKIRIVQ